MSVHFEMRAHVAVLTLDDPDRRNALSRVIVRGLLAGLQRARDERARAVVIAARGKAFCSGANMDDLRTGWMTGNEPDTDPVRLFRSVVEMPIPVVAAVQGPALGGGFELSMSCDLVVAGESAWFALPELGVGVIPNTALALLPQLIGRRRALECMLTRHRLTAMEAKAMGLVTSLTPPNGELEAALALAHQIHSAVTPSALEVAKRHLRLHAPIDWDRVRSSLHEVDPSEWEEGLSAFTERRAFDHGRFWPNA